MTSVEYLRIPFFAIAVVFVAAGCSAQSNPDSPSQDLSGPSDSETASNEDADCCTCDFVATETFYPQGDFQCTFDYPAHWEAQYDKWENVVYVKAPRCEQRCEGARSMAFTISTGKDNNADTEEELALSQGVVTQVGSVSCGGRKGPAFRPPGSTPDGRIGSVNFHVGNNDGLAYDARAQFSCPEPGEWQELEKLFLETVK